MMNIVTLLLVQYTVFMAAFAASVVFGRKLKANIVEDVETEEIKLFDYEGEVTAQ